jgi:hypothetical protein
MLAVTRYAAVLAIAIAAPAADLITLRQSDDRVDVLAGGQVFTSFHFGAQWDKPFLHPLRTSDGITVSRGFPLENIEGETTDHTWHRGIWWSHGDINGVDFWREKPGQTGRMVVRGKPTVKGDTISADVELLSPQGEVLGTVREQFRFSMASKDRLIDVTITISADRGQPLKMGDTEEGCLGIRFRDEFRQDRGAMLLNAEGLRKTENIWGKRSTWIDYSTEVNGRTAGVAVFDHPSNPKHPTWWHARGYAFAGANPFGEHDFMKDKTRDGSMTIPAGSHLEFRYQVVIHPGNAENANIQELYRQYRKATPSGAAR